MKKTNPIFYWITLLILFGWSLLSVIAFVKDIKETNKLEKEYLKLKIQYLKNDLKQ